jgi:hypothetical protein
MLDARNRPDRANEESIVMAIIGASGYLRKASEA